MQRRDCLLFSAGADVRVPIEHLLANMTGKSLDGLLRDSGVFCQSADESVVLAGYPFTAPAVKPVVIYRWKRMSKMAAGIEARVATAMAPPHSLL